MNYLQSQKLDRGHMQFHRILDHNQDDMYMTQIRRDHRRRILLVVLSLPSDFLHRHTNSLDLDQGFLISVRQDQESAVSNDQ